MTVRVLYLQEVHVSTFMHTSSKYQNTYSHVSTNFEGADVCGDEPLFALFRLCMFHARLFGNKGISCLIKLLGFWKRS